MRARDLEGDAEFDVRARVTVNATGVWTTEMERLAGVESPLPVRPSKGVHIVVPRDRIDSQLALILPTEKSVLFVLPWGDALDHRHHRHRRGSSASTIPPPAAPTSTTCSGTPTRSCASR